jgi:bacterioferritin
LGGTGAKLHSHRGGQAWDLALEQANVATLTEAISHCARVEDFTTRGMLEAMVRDEETHVDWLETQLETAQQLAVELYLSQQIKNDDD